MTDTRRRSSAKARKVIWCAMLTYALAQVIVGLALDYRWPEVRHPDLIRICDIAGQLAHNPEVISLGSSRLGLAIRPADFRTHLRRVTGEPALSAYNAAVPHGDLLTSDLVLTRLLAQGTRPRLVVVEVNPENVAQYNAWLDADMRSQLTWGDVPSLLRELTHIKVAHYRSLFFARCTPLHLYRMRVREKLAAAWYDPPDSGPPGPTEEAVGYGWEDVYTRLPDPASYPLRSQMMLPDLRSWLKDYQIGGLSAKALEHLLKQCRRRDIHVVLVGVPVTACYRACYTPEIRRQYVAYMRHLTDKYGCRFVDYYDQVPDDQFFDGYHLLSGGGAYISRRLAEEVVAPAYLSLIGRTAPTTTRNVSLETSDE